MIGGTRFVGRHIVEAALAAGHDVTLFHRGQTGPELFPDVEHRLGDRTSDLSALATGTWDATVDTCAYYPRQVTELHDALGDRGGQYVFVSSVSAYADPPAAAYDEDSPLRETDDPTAEVVTNDNYGALKVLCERAAVEHFGAGTLIVRPTYVVGPDDYSWRFPWWVARIAAGGEVLVPGPAGDHAQIIDGRDMAAWIVDMIERCAPGVFHAVAPSASFTWGELMELIVDNVGPAGTTLTWADEQWLLAEGMDGAILPMWSGGDGGRLMSAADPSAAYRAGLMPRSLATTIRDTLAWTRTQQQPASAGLAPEREADLLRRWHQRVAETSN